MLAAAGLASLVAAVTPGQGQAAGAPEFTMVPSRGLVGSFGGFGGQFNQHVFADISGPPPNLSDLEAKMVALRPRYVRVFFNNSEWTFPDRMASFVRTVQLANRAEATIEVAWQGGTFAFGMQNMPRFADVLTDLLEHQGIPGPLWVSLYNEPNSSLLTFPSTSKPIGCSTPSCAPAVCAIGSTSWVVASWPRRAGSGSRRPTGTGTWRLIWATCSRLGRRTSTGTSGTPRRSSGG